MLPQPLVQRAYNSVCFQGIVWPEMRFAPRRVRLGANTEIALIPHLAEFDAEALFRRDLTYEKPVFAWLATHVPTTYDLVLEIGANVGIFTIFLDRLYQTAGRTSAAATKPRIVAFEPSPQAFERLLENFAANDMQFTRAYQAAIGPVSGMRTFYEPTGHLTNGSFLREFSEIFSDAIEENPVVTVAASELDRWLVSARRPLIKIDVEGFEPELLAALKPLIDRYRPDLLIEVLSFTVDALNSSAALEGYERHLLTDNGAEAASSLYASDSHRDWLLRWPGDRTANAPAFG